MNKVLFVLVALAMAGAGCSKDDSGDKPTTKSDETKPTAGDPPATKSPPDKQVPAEPPSKATKFDLDAFCAAAFPMDEVAKLMKVDLALQKPESEPPKGFAQCIYIGTQMPPKGTALLRVDCRAFSADLHKQRTIFKQITDTGYEEISLGIGGSKGSDKASGLHLTMFIHDKVPCFAQVSTTFIKADLTGELAEMVYARIDDSNRPQ